MKSRSIRRITAIFAALSLGLATAIAAPAQAATPEVPAPNKVIDDKSVGIQMFMYSWNSIANECTSYLGPAGIDWVQVSPPQEHIKGSQWWVHYQPVSYQLESSLGNRAQFINMVQKCNQAGVGIIVDAVINHMANGSGIGFAGSSYDKYDYPGIYSAADFHSGLPSSDPSYCGNDISDYNDTWQNVHCELGGLPDLNTGSSKVRTTIAAYLNDLIDIGVTGFRVDAAKHMGVEDLSAVVSLLKPVNGAPPVIMSEVIGDSTTNQPFVNAGNKVWAWTMPDNFVNTLSSPAFIGYAKGTSWLNEYNGSQNTITMVSNHDTEHHGPSSLTYKDGMRFQLAHLLQLSSPYGIPQIYTGYGFSYENDGPAEDPNTGLVKLAKCPKNFYQPATSLSYGVYSCAHRWTAIRGMIKWRDAAGADQISHGAYTRVSGASYVLRLNRGGNWVAMNPTEKPLKAKLNTYLPAGKYCDVISGGPKPVKSNKTCIRTMVTVTSNGTATVTIPALSAIAIGAFSKAK